MIRCHWCGTQNYAIDSWCARCSRHLDFAPPPRRPSRRRGLILLAPAVAALAVAVVLALPAASWFQGVGRVAAPAIPDTAIRPAASASVETTPTSSPAPTPDTTPMPDATPAPEATPAPGPPVSLPPPVAEVPPVGDPAAAVARFYQAVSGHDFVTAAALWTPRMQAEFPPTEYIDHRFAATQAINLRAERALGDRGGLALVYVDVVEVIGGQTRHWVGTWQLIDTASGWLLNRPNLRAA